MRYSSLCLTCWTLLLYLFIEPVITQLPPILPTNEKELKTTLDDISYSVNKISSPNFKVSPTFFARLLRSLETPSTPQPAATQVNGTMGGTLGNIGRFVLGIVRWSVDLAKAIKQNKLDLVTNNGTASHSVLSVSSNGSASSPPTAASTPKST